MKHRNGRGEQLDTIALQSAVIGVSIRKLAIGLLGYRALTIISQHSAPQPRRCERNRATIKGEKSGSDQSAPPTFGEEAPARARAHRSASANLQKRSTIER